MYTAQLAYSSSPLEARQRRSALVHVVLHSLYAPDRASRNLSGRAGIREDYNISANEKTCMAKLIPPNLAQEEKLRSDWPVAERLASLQNPGLLRR